jgi:hypothetical protein
MSNDDPVARAAPPAERIATARRLRELHGQRENPYEPICRWCLKSWPCPDERWSKRVLRLAAEARY